MDLPNAFYQNTVSHSVLIKGIGQIHRSGKRRGGGGGGKTKAFLSVQVFFTLTFRNCGLVLCFKANSSHAG